MLTHSYTGYALHNVAFKLIIDASLAGPTQITSSYCKTSKITNQAITYIASSIIDSIFSGEYISYGCIHMYIPTDTLTLELLYS